jgi:hypothetical protein
MLLWWRWWSDTLLSDTYKVMSTHILAMLVMVWPEVTQWLPSKCYWRFLCNHRYIRSDLPCNLEVLLSQILCDSLAFVLKLPSGSVFNSLKQLVSSPSSFKVWPISSSHDSTMISGWISSDSSCDCRCNILSLMSLWTCLWLQQLVSCSAVSVFSSLAGVPLLSVCWNGDRSEVSISSLFISPFYSGWLK